MTEITITLEALNATDVPIDQIYQCVLASVESLKTMLDEGVEAVVKVNCGGVL